MSVAGCNIGSLPQDGGVLRNTSRKTVVSDPYKYFEGAKIGEFISLSKK